jgi:hypothetical protein
LILLHLIVLIVNIIKKCIFLIDISDRNRKNLFLVVPFNSQSSHVEVEVLTEVTMEITIFLDVTPCGLIPIYKTKRRHIPEHINL